VGSKSEILSIQASRGVAWRKKRKEVSMSRRFILILASLRLPLKVRTGSEAVVLTQRDLE